MMRKAFTLLELLLANMLIAILLGAMLLVISSLSREQKKNTKAQDQDSTSSILTLLRRDLANSETVRPLPNNRGFILLGHAALDAKSLTPTDRRSRVIYEIRRRANVLCLIREQSFLDDPIKPRRFEELLATNVTALSLSAPGATSADTEELNLDEASAFTLPNSVTIHVDLPHRPISQELFLR